MPLEEYRRKRDFAITPEPAPADLTGSTGRFVIQRHRATRLHYDFRLEIDGVLVSWAVPKGPTLDPSIRRMAVHVEDHPIEYFDFEGVIPAKQYGAGDVIVWDWGTWEPEAPTLDPKRAIQDGELKFRIDGQKVKGRFTIVRTGGRNPRAEAFSDDADQWLLIHKRDEFAEAGWDAEDHPQSVKTGRTNDEVKANRDAVWISHAPAAVAEIDLGRAETEPMPDAIEPMAATLATKPFRDEDWLFEIKWDGFRVQAHVDHGRVRTYTRNLNDAATYFPRLLEPAAKWIAAEQAIVDGEVVALEDDGRPDFGLLQTKLGQKSAAGLVYQAFDLLYLDGRSLIDVPLEDRKRLLRSVLQEHPRVRYASHVETEGVVFFEAAKANGVEGMVAKLRRSRYEPGRRSSAWLKIKIRPEQELVVGGWTPGQGNARDLGALAIGVYEDGKLRFTGKVGSGFTGAIRRDLLERLEPLAQADPPFDPPPPTDYRGRWGGELKDVTWVRPELVIRAELGGWSRDGIVRQAAFKGVETERDATTVVRETAITTAAAVREAEAALPPPEQEAPMPGPTKRTTLSASRRAPASGSKGTAPAASKGAPASGSKAPAPAPAAGAGVSEEELATLASMPKEGVWRVAGRDLKVTNLDKPLFEGRDGGGPITKRELIAYYTRIAPTMLPHLAERPLNLHRFPNGAGAQGFWQKDMPDTTPGWLRIWLETGYQEREDRKPNKHLIAEEPAALCWLANQASFEIHAWTGKLPEPWAPTFAYIDVDPGEKTTWEETLVLTRLYRTALQHLGVRGYPKTTGQRGIQVWIPIEHGRYTFEDTSAWVEKVSRAVGSTVPELISWEWSKAERKGRARLDYTQNASIKTLVAPYSVRPAPGAPVSTPITWDELDDPDLRPNRWTIRDVVERVAAVGDLFAPAQTDAQVLPPV